MQTGLIDILFLAFYCCCGVVTTRLLFDHIPGYFFLLGFPVGFFLGMLLWRVIVHFVLKKFRSKKSC
ncbi:MAG: hypothetical protein PHW04_11810 [Candidatus Wallbacteria bacterium]|nr:hypothetical protein [Candidatus Wallbacteria bacterium]